MAPILPWKWSKQLKNCVLHAILISHSPKLAHEHVYTCSSSNCVMAHKKVENFWRPQQVVKKLLNLNGSLWIFSLKIEFNLFHCTLYCIVQYFVSITWISINSINKSFNVLFKADKNKKRQTMKYTCFI